MLLSYWQHFLGDLISLVGWFYGLSSLVELMLKSVFFFVRNNFQMTNNDNDL